jgi:hypothetical protein
MRASIARRSPIPNRSVPCRAEPNHALPSRTLPRHNLRTLSAYHKNRVSPDHCRAIPHRTLPDLT